MRKSSTLSRGRFIVAWAILFLPWSVAAVFSMELSFFIGETAVIRDGKSLSLEVRMPVKTGDTIVTGKGAVAVLSFPDGSEIKLSEKSRVKVGSLAMKGSDSVSVISGSINAKFKKLLKGDERRVCTPTTVCAVRGTDFLVGVSEGADSRVDLNDGALDVRNPYGRVDLKAGEQSEIGVGELPSRGKGGAAIEDWKTERDAAFEKDPGVKSGQFTTYLDKLNERSGELSGSISDFDRSLGKKRADKDEMEKAGSRLSELEEGVEDDLLLGEAAESSIDGILGRFQKEREEIYSAFLKVKEESNRVLEQQRKNLEAIQAVKEAYRKAYDEIMKTHKEYLEKIKGGVDRESVKPAPR